MIARSTRTLGGDKGDRMEFRSNKLIGIAAGVITGFMGLSTFLIVLIFADQGAPIFLIPVGALLILVSVICFTFKSTVRING